MGLRTRGFRASQLAAIPAETRFLALFNLCGGRAESEICPLPGLPPGVSHREGVAESRRDQHDRRSLFGIHKQVLAYGRQVLN